MPLIFWCIHPLPLYKNKKRPNRSFSIFGGSGWIRTTSVVRQQIYRLPRLTNSRARPILVRAEGTRTYKNTMSCVISNELMFASQGYPIHMLPATSLVRAEGIEPSFQAWKARILAFELCSQQFLSPFIITDFFINASVYSNISTLSIYLRDTLSIFTGLNSSFETVSFSSDAYI